MRDTHRRLADIADPPEIAFAVGLLRAEARRARARAAHPMPGDMPSKLLSDSRCLEAISEWLERETMR